MAGSSSVFIGMDVSGVHHFLKVFLKCRQLRLNSRKFKMEAGSRSPLRTCRVNQGLGLRVRGSC